MSVLSISNLTNLDNHDDSLDLDLADALDMIEDGLDTNDSDVWEARDLRLMRTSGANTLDALATCMALAGVSA